MSMPISSLPPLSSNPASPNSQALALKPQLPHPTTGCLGFAMVELAEKIDFNNTNYVQVATKVCHTLLENLQSFSTEHLKKLEERASFLQSNQWWSTIVNVCSFVGSALAIFSGLSSRNPAAAVMTVCIGLLPFVYEALSTGVEQKEIDKGIFQFGTLLATALLLNYFRAYIPALQIPNLMTGLQTTLSVSQTIAGMGKGIYDTRITWKKGELDALQFLTSEIQTKLQEMTGSMTDNIKAIASNHSFLNEAMSKYIETKKAFI